MNGLDRLTNGYGSQSAKVTEDYMPRSSRITMMEQLKQNHAYHTDKLARVNAAIALLEKHPDFAEFLDVIGQVG